ncbi:MAG: DUF3892 domain-containing protein [SAR324 cluster bacterium]|nr:DUF3892 domain-containing protein [SAR324 cluster bacterium]
MIERLVTHTQKDEDGDIIRIGNKNEQWAFTVYQAIYQIKNNKCLYYSRHPTCSVMSEVIVVNDRVKGEYLRTASDGHTENNLDNLPDL